MKSEITREEANVRMSESCNTCRHVCGWHIMGLKTCKYFGDVPVTGVCDLWENKKE